MRLLLAELGKLRRPLSWGVAGAAAVFCVLLAAGGAHNAMGQAQAEIQVAAQLDPLAAGAEAAGLMASLPGALAFALLAGAHIGGEWSGRTMKNLLSQQGRRRRVLAAKLASLWLAGVGLIAVCWAALAIAGPVLVHIDHLRQVPAAQMSAAHAISHAGSQVARALLVLAVFAVIGLLAAVLTRSTIGTTAATAGAVIAMLVAAALPGTGRWTPAAWVQAWMRFPAGQASITSLPTNFWSRFIGVTAGGQLALIGLAGMLAVGCALAAAVFRRTDISG